jgi:sodium/bile acid cotransporter 7
MQAFKIRGRLRIDPYLVALVATVIVASLLPARGAAANIFGIATNIAIGMLFFLYGARLSPQTMLQGFVQWRLQLLVLLCTFALFPLVGAALLKLAGGWLPPPLASGLMFLCLLPSTVQSSIAFTAIARGNVPAALCCASLSNTLGVFLTPMLTLLVLRTNESGFSFNALRDISLQLLLPFALGQVARPWIGDWIMQHKRLTSFFDRGTILMIVYEAFSAGVVAGIWHQVDGLSLALVAILDLVLLAMILSLTTFLSRWLRFSKEDEITIVFCGSKKSLASGLPMANILFSGQTAGLAVLPLMLFHQAQLFACAILAQRYANRKIVNEPVPATPAAGGP